MQARRCPQRAERGWSRVGSELPAQAFGLCIGVVLSLTGCAPDAGTPITQPVEAMEAPWGPFARQCDSTRLSHDTVRWRVGQTEVAAVYQTCTGFSAMPAGRDAEEITASVGTIDPPSSPVVLRIVRRTDGVARPARLVTPGLLAQGSDVPGRRRDTGPRYRPYGAPGNPSKRDLGHAGSPLGAVPAGCRAVVPSGRRASRSWPRYVGLLLYAGSNGSHGPA